MKILYVEDEILIAEAIEQVLKDNKYNVDLAFDGEYGLDCGLSGIYDIIILDVMLPKMDGIKVLKELRKNNIKVPILLLTAKGQIEDKIKGLDSGADDYLAKPFHTDELLARLRALGRRQAELIQDGLLRYNDIALNPYTHIISCADYELQLTPKEAQILELLIREKDTSVSKDAIITKIWGYDSEAEDNHVEIHISNLRKKLIKLESDTSINTIRGEGYILRSIKDDKRYV